MYRIRLASRKDAAAVLDLYAPYVTSTTVSFEVEPPSVDEYADRIQSALDRYTFLVLERMDNMNEDERGLGTAGEARRPAQTLLGLPRTDPLATAWRTNGRQKYPSTLSRVSPETDWAPIC